MDRPEMCTKDLSQEKIRMLGELFPNCITETKETDGDEEKTVLAVDFDSLKQELSNHVVEGPKERYQFTWPDKSKARVLANTSTTMALRPCRELSVNFGDTKNLYIEGDNLEVLKILRETYLGQVKMIYIDPPYNTGGDFVYDDDFSRTIEEYSQTSGDLSNQGDRLFLNTTANGRFHTDWLNMIYPRMILARDFLREDGVIFISIDDHEVDNLTKICNEIYGECNHVANIVWQRKYGPANDAITISSTHEYILVYCKNRMTWKMGLFDRSEDQLKAFKNPDDDPRGPWRASDLSARTYSPTCDYTITGPTGISFNPPASRSWIVSEKRFKELLQDNRITFGLSGTGRPMEKKFLSEVRQGITPETWWSRDFADDNKVARYELKDLFPENVFDTPKPTKLITQLMRVANIGDGDIVLDFFAGSSTTAHAVFRFNCETNHSAQFILVQMPEVCDKSSSASKAGYSKISEIGMERIRRAGKLFSSQHLDTGFRVFRIDDSNTADVFQEPESFKQTNMEQFRDNIKSDRSEEDLLVQSMLEFSIPLSAKIESNTIDGVPISIVNDGFLIACLSDECNESIVTSIVEMKPSYIVIRSGSNMTDQALANIEHMINGAVSKTILRIM